MVERGYLAPLCVQRSALLMKCKARIPSSCPHSNHCVLLAALWSLLMAIQTLLQLEHLSWW